MLGRPCDKPGARRAYLLVLRRARVYNTNNSGHTNEEDVFLARNVTKRLTYLIVFVLGILVGLCAFTFYYAEGLSYAGNASETCVNCHIMREHFDSWSRSSHHAVATCNDCHTPHDFLGKYYVKGMNGLHHSWAFTTGRYPNNIRIKEGNARVAQQNCVDCHQTMVSVIHRSDAGEELSCVSCHGSVGHRRR